MLSVSLDCPFLIAPGGLSKLYGPNSCINLFTSIIEIRIPEITSHNILGRDMSCKIRLCSQKEYMKTNNQNVWSSVTCRIYLDNNVSVYT